MRDWRRTVPFPVPMLVTIRVEGKPFKSLDCSNVPIAPLLCRGWAMDRAFIYKSGCRWSPRPYRRGGSSMFA